MVGGIIVLAGLYLVVTALLARRQLLAVRSEVRQLRAQINSGDLAAAKLTALQIGAHARSGHDYTGGPVWSLAAALPGGGQALHSIRVLTAEADSLGNTTLPALVTAADRLDPKTLRRADGSIDLARITSAAPTLDRAESSVVRATRAIKALPAQSWLGPVDSARRDLLSQVGALGRTVRSADLAARIAPAMLGQDGVKRYFVAFQNDAEARGTGGIPGAFAIVRADHGKITFERFEPDNTLGVEPTGLDFGPGYEGLFRGARTTSLYVNSNLSPHFPYAAQVWLAMWRKHSGQRLDGAVAVDPSALSYLLAVTGPARLPNGTLVGAGNVVQLTQNTVYFAFPTIADNSRRKQYLLDIARAASHQVLDAKVGLVALLRAAGRAAGERRLLVYSAQPNLESELEQTSLSGAIPDTARPYAGLSIVNDGGNKLDYYLDRSLAWQSSGCGATRAVTVTVTLTNNAPSTHLPFFLVDRSDRHAYPTKPGDNRLEVSYYATRGAAMSAVDINGRPGTAAVGADRGHPVYTVDLELPRGATRTIVLHLREPGAGRPLVLRQPLVRPLHVRLADAAC